MHFAAWRVAARLAAIFFLKLQNLLSRQFLA